MMAERFNLMKNGTRFLFKGYPYIKVTNKHTNAINLITCELCSFALSEWCVPMEEEKGEKEWRKL